MEGSGEQGGKTGKGGISYPALTEIEAQPAGVTLNSLQYPLEFVFDRDTNRYHLIKKETSESS